MRFIKKNEELRKLKYKTTRKRKILYETEERFNGKKNQVKQNENKMR